MSVKIRLLADGLMILKVLFLKTLTLLHLLIFISRLFYNDLWIDGAFKKPWLVLKKEIFWIASLRDQFERILSKFYFVEFIKLDNFLYKQRC